MRNEAKLGRAGASGGWRVGEADCAKQSQFARPGRVGRGLGAWDVGQMRKTNPILEEVSGLKCQVASEMRKTNPICLVGCGRGGRNVRNEPNLFPEAEMRHHSDIPLWECSNPMPIVHNEPHSRQGRVGRGQRGVGRGAKCAKRTQFSEVPGGTGPGDAGWEVYRAKQTQFSGAAGREAAGQPVCLVPDDLEDRFRSANRSSSHTLPPAWGYASCFSCSWLW
jgi:hypothetical protein